jgi:hypothetical protein
LSEVKIALPVFVVSRRFFLVLTPIFPDSNAQTDSGTENQPAFKRRSNVG